MIKKILFVIFLFTVFTITTPSQSTPEQAVLNARDQFFDIKKRSIELERMKREADKRPISENFKLKFPEIKEDFEQIQKLNNEILQLTAVKTPINYSSVFKFVSEIKRRAMRLKSNLFSVEPTDDKEAKNKRQIIETQDIKALLDILDKSINSFVHSSLFQNLNLVNPKELLSAQKDLETAIETSSAIKETAKKLAKENSEN